MAWLQINEEGRKCQGVMPLYFLPSLLFYGGHNENLMRNIIVLSNKIRGLGIIPNKHFCILAEWQNVKNLASGRTDAVLAVLHIVEKFLIIELILV